MQRDLAALIAFVDSRQNVPHRWGRQANDCAGFALDAVEAQTGVAVAADLTWSNRAQALRVIRRFGSLEAAFDNYFERVPIGFAMRGDIAGVIVSDAFGLHPMIVEGPTLVGPGDDGNTRLPRRVMVCAWSAVKQKKRESAQ